MGSVTNTNMENRALVYSRHGVWDIVLRIAWHTGRGHIFTGDLLRAFGTMLLYLDVLNRVWFCRRWHLFSHCL